MSGCRVGQVCDSGGMITDAVPVPMGTTVGSDKLRANLIVNGKFSECLQLRSDVANTRRLLPVLFGGTVVGGAAALGMGLAASEAQAAEPSSAKSKSAAGTVGAVMAGIFTAAVGGGWGYERWQLGQVQTTYAALGCDEVIRTVKGTDSQEFQGMGYCSGVDVLVGDCVPQRHPSNGYEGLTEPVSARDIAIGAGVVVVGAVAVYTGVAGVAALAEAAASWGWVPVLLL